MKPSRSASLKQFALLCVFACVVLVAACGGQENGADSRTSTPEPLVPFTPVILQPTNTPLPAPPTPTPRPSSTPAPVPQGVDTPMLAIPAATFSMGSAEGNADAQPPHPVTVNTFQIDQFEVTNDDFQKFVDATGYETDAEKNGSSDNWYTFYRDRANHPVVKVSWNDASAFCNWAGKRLPTEAEWEYAARGTAGFTYPWGDTFSPVAANLKAAGLRGTAAVGSYPAGASPFGVHDMAGNVAEWTATVPEPYPGSEAGSRLFGSNLYILRGGGWFSTEEQATTYYRNSNVPLAANDDLGFRCAK
jgi:formylglycine-generating enzyme required for sulfatase activity